MNVYKAYETESYSEGKPNIINWRSQDLGSMGQPICVYLKIIIMELKTPTRFQ